MNMTRNLLAALLLFGLLSCGGTGKETHQSTQPGMCAKEEMAAVGEKENPCQITILETYASREAYGKHIASAHFQKYKQGTLHMVKSLELIDQTPLNPANRINNFME